MPNLENGEFKVLEVVPYPVKKSSPDGVSNYAKEKAKALKERGADVVIVSCPSEDSAADHEVGYSFNVAHNGTTLKNALILRKKELVRVGRKVKPQVLSIQEPATVFLPLAAHRAYKELKESGELLDTIEIVTVHGFNLRMNKRSRAGFKVVRELIKPLIRDSHARIAISEPPAKAYEGYYPDYSWVVSENAVDTEIHKPKDNGQDNPEKNDIELLYAGRFESRKGVDDLIISVYNLKKQGYNVRLKLVGEGKMREELERLAKRLGLTETEVEFLEVLDEENFPQAYDNCDIFVSPSRDGEAKTRTLIEGFAHGKVCVGCRIPGHDWIEGYKFARRANPEDPDDLTRAIIELIEVGPDERRRLGKDARLFAEKNYSWRIRGKQILDHYLELYEEEKKKKEQPRFWLPPSKVIFDSKWH